MKMDFLRVLLLAGLSLALCGCAAIALNKTMSGRDLRFGKDLYELKNYELAEQALMSAAVEAEMRGAGSREKAEIWYYLGETERALQKYPAAERALMKSRGYAAKAWKSDVAWSGKLSAAFVFLYRDMKEPAKGWPFLKDAFDQPAEGRGDVDWAAVYREYVVLLEGAGMSAEAAILHGEIAKLERT